MTGHFGVHRAVVAPAAPGLDDGAAGAAVTVALCGHWEHEGSCRWPHHNAVEQVDARVVLRTVFVADEQEEPEVRRLIAESLRAGQVVGPDGRSRWDLVAEGPADPTDDERELAARLARS